MPVAVKIITGSLSGPDGNEIDKSRENELRLLKLRHKKIVRKCVKCSYAKIRRPAAMYGHYESESSSSLYLILEFMAGGSLKTLLGRATLLTMHHFALAESARCINAVTSTGTYKYEYNVAQAISWMKQAARGLSYLHGEGVRVHLHYL